MSIKNITARDAAYSEKMIDLPLVSTINIVSRRAIHVFYAWTGPQTFILP